MVGEEQRQGVATAVTPQQRLLAAGLVLTVFISAFEATAVITALPTIADQLHGRSLYGTVFAVSLLATLIAIVAAGEYADRKGPATPFVAAAILFVSGLIVAATATTMVQIVGGRFLQGLGIGGFSSLAYVTVSRGFPAERRPTMYAVLSAGWVLPSLVAPLLAGWITQRFGWEWVFLTMIPVPIIAGIVVVPKLRSLRPEPQSSRPPSRLPQAIILTAGAACVLAGVQIRPVVAGVVVAAAGIAIAARPLQRLFPAGTFRARRGLPAVVFCRLLATMAFLGVDSFIPLAADRVHHASPTVQGFVIIGSALAWTAAQAISARLNKRIQPATLTRIGFSCLAVGALLVIPVVFHGWPLWVTFVTWSLGGFGMGMLFNPTTVVAMAAAHAGEEGLVSSQVNIADSLGFAAMSTLGGAVVAITEHTTLALGPALIGLFVACSAIAVVGGVAAGRIRLAH